MSWYVLIVLIESALILLQTKRIVIILGLIGIYHICRIMYIAWHMVGYVTCFIILL